MTPERLQEIKRLYHSARQREGEERTVYLQQVCAGDDALRHEVESLLAQDGPIDEFLPPSAADVSLIGRRIAHYLVVEEIGRGGMGIVYRGHDDRLRRDVAIKVLSEAGVNTGQERDRVLHEARACCALNHAGIVTVYDVCEADSRLFIVMELVRGQTLHDVISRGPLDLRAALRLGAQLAAALDAAHRAGILHGDIKPRNILVQSNGQAKLLDFGIARPNLDQTLTMTRAALRTANVLDGEIAGTIPYMAPEQLRGELIGPPADLYSLGVVLYEASSGKRPFFASSGTDLLDKVLTGKPPDLHLPGDLHDRFARMVHRLLEKQPDARYHAAAELQRDIASLQRDLDLAEYLQTEAAGKRSVAVLPFRLLTPGTEDEYLSIALADAVINQLSTSPHLLVRPTSSIVNYAHGDATVMGRELNVDFVVDGSIQKHGTQMRVHLQARQTLDGRSLASLRFDSGTADLFTLQDRMGQDLLKALTPKTEGRSESRPPTHSALAFELYLRAEDRLSRMNRWDLDRAVELLTQATALDAGFADAWARLAEVCIQIGVVYEGTAEWFARAEDAIHAALQLDSNNADAHCAEGQLLWTPQRNYANAAALRALNRALNLNPGCHQAQVWRGLILFHLGLHVEARQSLMAALAQNPSDVRTLTFIGHTALYSGDYDLADEYDARALAADPKNVWANLFYPGIALYVGAPDRAMERIRLARQLLPEEPTIDSTEALVWAHRGETAKAYSILEQALARGKPLLHIHHMWHDAASVYAMGGDADRAIRWLRSAADMGLPNYPLFVRDPHLRPLAGNTQFQQFMAGVKTEWLEFRRQFGDSAVAESAQ